MGPDHFNRQAVSLASNSAGGQHDEWEKRATPIVKNSLTNSAGVLTPMKNVIEASGTSAQRTLFLTREKVHVLRVRTGMRTGGGGSTGGNTGGGVTVVVAAGALGVSG